jgi:hypothetical protein
MNMKISTAITSCEVKCHTLIAFASPRSRRFGLRDIGLTTFAGTRHLALNHHRGAVWVHVRPPMGLDLGSKVRRTSHESEPGVENLDAWG